MDEVKRRRRELDWTADRLAEEMAAVGIPWTRDVVVNLENGRRKSVAAHEVTALAYVLDAETPLDLLVPPVKGAIPVTPHTHVISHAAKAWFLGKTGPLRRRLEARGPLELKLIADIREVLQQHDADHDDIDSEGLVESLTKSVISYGIAEAVEAVDRLQAEASPEDTNSEHQRSQAELEHTAREHEEA